VTNRTKQGGKARRKRERKKRELGNDLETSGGPKQGRVYALGGMPELQSCEENDRKLGDKKSEGD
jgi:hypothetical protein